MKVLFSEGQIQTRIKELAREINETYGNEEIYLLCVLKGAIMFFTDLAKHLKMPVKMEFIRLSSYGDSQTSSGSVKAIDLTLPNLEGKNILVVEDIVDTGLTLHYLKNFLTIQHNPKSVKIITLLDKKCARKTDVDIDFTGFIVGNEFVVGYGLDYQGLERNLPMLFSYQ